MPNVLHLSTYSSTGGASFAARRIFQSLQNLSLTLGDNGYLRLEWYSTRDNLRHRLKNHISQRLVRYLSNLPSRQSIDLFPSRLHHYINKSHADLVHLHWCQDEFLPIESIIKIRKPIIWTLHDHWPFQGALHLPSPSLLNSTKPLPTQSFPWPSIDFESWCLHRKSPLANKDIRFAAPSTWLCQRLGESALFSSRPCYHIPNPVDDADFPVNTKSDSRISLGLPALKKTILYVASSFTTDTNKGFDILIKSLQLLAPQINFALVTVGDLLETNLPYQHINLGYVTSSDVMAQIYSACDVLVVPSIFDNMPQVATEALTCGLPVVGFANGGLLDIVTPECGRLAKPYSVPDLARALLELLSIPLPDFRSSSSFQNFRSSVCPENVARMYLRLYEETLNLPPAPTI